MSKAVVETFLGEMFDVLEPQSSQVWLLDIAHALARVNRYGGMAATTWSVAQHSLLCKYIADNPPLGKPWPIAEGDANRCSVELELAMLLHDTAEVYSADLTAPLKHNWPVLKEAWTRLEANLDDAIAAALSFDYRAHPWKPIDELAYLIEKTELFGHRNVRRKSVSKVPFEYLMQFRTLSERSPVTVTEQWLVSVQSIAGYLGLNKLPVAPAERFVDDLRLFPEQYHRFL